MQFSICFIAGHIARNRHVTLPSSFLCIFIRLAVLRVPESSQKSHGFEAHPQLKLRQSPHSVNLRS